MFNEPGSADGALRRGVKNLRRQARAERRMAWARAFALVVTPIVFAFGAVVTLIVHLH
jgi:hypothetical protein